MVHVLVVDFEMHADSARQSPSFNHQVILVREGLTRLDQACGQGERYKVKVATTVNHIWKSTGWGRWKHMLEVGGGMAYNAAGCIDTGCAPEVANVHIVVNWTCILVEH